jgi:glycerol-3-phosphate O-acyltransferase
MSQLSGRFWALFTRASIQPEEAAAQLNERGAPVCYVFETASDTDAAVLRQLSASKRLPRVSRHLPGDALRGLRASFALQKPVGVWTTRSDRRTPVELLRIVQAAQQDPEFDLRLVPVAVYWGRAPQKERSFIRLVLSDDWLVASRLRRLFRVLINGRHVMVQTGAPVSLQSLLGERAEVPLAARRVSRALRSQLARLRTARIGPDLSHRRTLLAEVLRSRVVRAAAAQKVRSDRKLTRRAALLEARRCGEEIAANYSHAFVAFGSGLLARLWNRFYDGIEVGHIETLERVADGNEIIYVPCHRSTADDLLLSYAVYQKGYAVPHIAAGINLDLPIVGRLLRMGGAFFIRRSFGGNAIYTAVITQYLSTIMNRGHSLAYFIEGGRSRTGRMLEPKTGMLSMTVLSYLRAPQRPLVFQPVYYGYERIFEGPTYLGELSGRPKEKESFWGLLQGLRQFFRERFGRVHVNFGEPIFLDPLLDQKSPGWRKAPLPDDERPRWVVSLVSDLADEILRHINAAAAVTPVNLLALVLLSTPRQAMLVSDLQRQIDMLLSLLRALPYHSRVTLTKMSAAAIVDYGVTLKLITREQHKSGEFALMSAESAVLATYYRNNVLHLVSLPSMIACCFIANAGMHTEDIERLASRIYPYVAAELFLRWREEEVGQVVRQTLVAMASLGLLIRDEQGDGWRRPEPTSAAAAQLSQLAQSTLMTIERYYLAIALLIHAGSGQITQKTLEERCQLMAQRMALLYGLHSPEFFDRALFAGFIDLLRSRGVVQLDEQRQLLFDEVLMRVARDAELVLSEQLRHSILQVTHSGP